MPEIRWTPALAAYREARAAFYARVGYRPVEAVATANLDAYVRALAGGACGVGDDAQS